MVERFLNAGYGFAVRIENSRQAANKNVILDGLLVSDQDPDAMAVDYTAGTAFIGGDIIAVGASSKSITAADGTNDRYDAVSVNASGTVTVTDGTPAANPFPPDMPSGDILLALVFVENNSSVVAAADVVDSRIVSPVVMNDSFVESGCKITEQASPDLDVDVDAGIISMQGNRIVVSSTTKTLSAADGADPRYDLISVDYLGAVTLTTGTAAASPVVPDVPVGSIPLAWINLPATDTTVTDDQITDMRTVAGDRGLRLLASTTLGGNAVQISVTGILAIYKRLVVEFDVTGHTDANSNLYLNINTDSGANYNHSRIMNATATVTGASTAGDTHIPITGQVIGNGEVAVGEITLYETGSRTFVKSSALKDTVATTEGTGDWASAAEIASVQLILDTGNMIAGSFVRVYGMID